MHTSNIHDYDVFEHIFPNFFFMGRSSQRGIKSQVYSFHSKSNFYISQQLRQLSKAACLRFSENISPFIYLKCYGRTKFPQRIFS